jgi:small subunit ribosomal protein S6
MPRPYELLVLVMPELADEALDAEIERVSGILAAQGAEITYLKRDTPWGRRRLAYPIGRFRDATYLLYRFNSEPQAIRRIEQELKLNQQVIRYLVTRYEEPPAVEETPEGETAEQTPAATEPDGAVVPQESVIPLDAEPSTVGNLTDPDQTPDPIDEP